jgi:hypothetical protein
MQTFVLQERPLTDNVLMLADEGKVFKGNYIAIIKENTFANAWSDKESIKKFRSQKMLDNYLAKNYPEFEY